VIWRGARSGPFTYFGARSRPWYRAVVPHALPPQARSATAIRFLPWPKAQFLKGADPTNPGAEIDRWWRAHRPRLNPSRRGPLSLRDDALFRRLKCTYCIFRTPFVPTHFPRGRSDAKKIFQPRHCARRE
jgi:hypothetical protein